MWDRFRECLKCFPPVCLAGTSPVLAFPPLTIGHLYAGFLSVARFEFSVCCLCERLWGVDVRFRWDGVLGGPLELCRPFSFIPWFEYDDVKNELHLLASCTQFLDSGWSVLALFRELFVAGGATSRSAYKVFTVEWLIGRLIVIFIVMNLNTRRVSRIGWGRINNRLVSRLRTHFLLPVINISVTRGSLYVTESLFLIKLSGTVLFTLQSTPLGGYNGSGNLIMKAQQIRTVGRLVATSFRMT
jgi:hypothetical protein